MSREVVRDAGGLQVRFPFDRRLVDLIKSLPRRRWLAAEKLWWVPEEDAVALVDLLAPEGFAFDEAVQRLYADLGGRLALEPTAPSPRPRPPGLFDDPAPEAETVDAYTVGRLNREVAAILERAFPTPLWLVGEISGFNRGRHKRHVGFSLVERDPDGAQVSQIAAILFEESRRRIEAKLEAAGGPFALEDEVEVRLLVRVDLYEAWGAYRVVVEDLDVAFTLGEAARRREEIVRKLSADGLLDKNTALPFPTLPLRVGLITSLGSDAFHDVIRTLSESGFAFRVTAHGARVQGRSTEPSVLNALDWFRPRLAHFDVLVICRGGGSRTDLAWFDSEALGRAVAEFPVPVVVGIGHEQDVSVLDHVGWRAKTPTAAAGMLVERVREGLERVGALGAAVLRAAGELLRSERAARRETARRLAGAVRAFLGVERVEGRRRREHLVRAAGRRLDVARTALQTSARQLGQAAHRDLAEERRRAVQAVRALGPKAARLLALEAERSSARDRRLHLVDPRRVVERGYAILRTRAGGVVVDPASAAEGTRLTAELRRGRLALRSEGPVPAEGEEEAR